MSLTTTLQNSFNNYDDTDVDWKNFIADHKDYLIANANQVTISQSYMQGYVFALARYLRSINYNAHCTWIIARINNLPNDLAFIDTIGVLLLPPFSIIQELYTSYITAKNNGT